MASQELVPSRGEVAHATLLDQITERQADVASRYMPTLTPKQFTDREKLIGEFREMLVEGVDYGVIPGTDKPTLLLPGAQKVCAYFGYVPRYREDKTIEDWDGDQFGEPLFYYRLTCELEKDSKRVGEGLGSCNSWESKYRYRWVGQAEAQRIPGWKDLPSRGGAVREFTFAVDKAETGGKYGKPAAYWQAFRDEIEAGTARKVKRADSKGTERDAWEIDATMYRVPNENFPDIINTVLKISKKRSYIDATLSATGLSQYFTQDVEDAEPEQHHQNGSQQAADNVARRKIEDATPAELRSYLAAIDSKQDGSLSSAFRFVQDELIRAGGKDGDTLFIAQTEALRARHPKGTPIPTGEAKGVILVLWGEVERLRKLKAQREKDEADSAFAVSQ